jgi:regulatory protein YycH of two-component signal transduction system YycFG
MDLEQRFDSVIMRHDLCRNEFIETKEQCVEIAEEYAIAFAYWIRQSGNLIILHKQSVPISRLLQEFKQEKQL